MVGFELRDAARVDLSDWHTWWRTSGHQELYQQLVRWWDPIGIKDISEAQGEYDGLAGALGRMLREGEGEQALAAFLVQSESEMGMAPRAELDAFVAGQLLDWYTAAMREPEGPS
jgi:hypothetical protein